MHELKIDKSTLKCLMRMYTNIKASVCVNGTYAQAFPMHEGVRQGCPASPLVFSLYMDRLEAFVESNLLSHLTATEKRAIRVAGILLPSLLFSDDIVFMGTDMGVVQRILDTLSTFCAQNHLSVSLQKTEWLLGGHRQKMVTAELDTHEDLLLNYRGVPL